MKAGALRLPDQPFKIDEVSLVVDRALERRTLARENLALRDEIKGRYRLDRLLGKSPPMQRVFDTLRKTAPGRAACCSSAKSGTGKELAARPCTSFRNCGSALRSGQLRAIPETLLESELFGHVKGSFTGAHADKQGLFEAAHNGTLLLDEVAELPVAMQVKLLRVLQERKVKPVGGVAEREVDVRIVAATNRDLETEVEKRNLSDKTSSIDWTSSGSACPPPARTARGSSPAGRPTSCASSPAEHGRKVAGVDPDAMQGAHGVPFFPATCASWKNLIERAVILSTGDRLTLDALPTLG